MKKLAIRLSIFLVAACLMLLVLEGAVRVLNAHTNIISIATQEPSSFLQPDDELNHVPAPNFGPMPFRVEHIEYELSSNEFGCFDKPYEKEDPYILLVGDSFTHHLASMEEKWGSAMEKELDTRVVQCGVSAYTTDQELGFAKRIVSEIGKPPELIVVGYFLNDFAEAMKRGSVMESGGTEKALPTLKKSNRVVQTTRWLFNHSFLFRYARVPGKTALLSTPLVGDYLLSKGYLQKQATSLDQMILYTQIAENEALAEKWVEHVESMKDFKQFANEQGAELLFVVIPWKFQVYDFFLESEIPEAEAREKTIEAPSNILQEVFAREEINSLDLLPLFRKGANLEPRIYLSGEEDLFFRFDLHWSPNGQRLAGLSVAEYIQDKGLLKASETDTP